MGLEGLLSGTMGGEKTPISGEALEEFRKSDIPIPDLKPGDKLIWKKGMKSCLIPAEYQIIEVYTVLNPPRKHAVTGSQHDMDLKDFTSVFKDSDGEIMVFAFDSRRFKRV